MIELEYIDRYPECKGCKHLDHEAEYVCEEVSIWWFCRKHTDGRLWKNCKERNT